MTLLPSGYTELEYIKSSGTQYVDTGYKANNNSRIVMDVQLIGANDNAWVFEGRISSSSASKGVFYYYTSTQKWCADYNGSVSRYQFQDIEMSSRMQIDYDKNVITINEFSHTFSATTFQSTANLTLLANNTDGAITGYANAILYKCQIYDNGQLIRDFVPCKNPSGEVGLYDQVGAQFYGNAGTGAFEAGPEVAQPNMYVKIDGIWQPVTGVYTKTNNTW